MSPTAKLVRINQMTIHPLKDPTPLHTLRQIAILADEPDDEPMSPDLERRLSELSGSAPEPETPFVPLVFPAHAALAAIAEAA
jgi:hypothetical protein